MTYPPPRYDDPSGVVSARLRPADAAPDLVGPLSSVHYLATGSGTGGDYGLYRWEMGAAPSGPGAHFHRTMSEAFYVLDGEVRLYDGERWIEATRGDFLYVPAGGIHAFRNESGVPASMLILFAPGAPREAYFEETADIARSGRELSPQEWDELYSRHDQYMVERAK
jgi:mannose-6-phosphate isomerase-like protein (cupin superfamily)